MNSTCIYPKNGFNRPKRTHLKWGYPQLIEIMNDHFRFEAYCDLGIPDFRDSPCTSIYRCIHTHIHPYTFIIYIYIYTYPHMYIYAYIDIRPYSDIRPQTSSTHSTARARCSIFSMPACACLGKFDHDRFFCSPEPWESMGLFKGIVIPKRPNYSGE